MLQDDNHADDLVPAIDVEFVNEDAAANNVEQQDFPFIPPEVIEGLVRARPFLINGMLTPE